MAVANTNSVDLDATPSNWSMVDGSSSRSNSISSSDDDDDDDEVALDKTPDFLLNFVDSSEPTDSDSDNDFPPPHSVHVRHPFVDDEAEESDDSD